jgi:hypothetical protein
LLGVEAMRRAHSWISCRSMPSRITIQKKEKERFLLLPDEAEFCC